MIHLLTNGRATREAEASGWRMGLWIRRNRNAVREASPEAHSALLRLYFRSVPGQFALRMKFR
jgi:hypothetical protein